MSRASPARVLVVDDDPLLRRIYTRALERLAVDAVVVADGDAAVAAARRAAFTLALVDLHLVGEGGVEVAARIREAQVEPPTFVCISGSVSVSDVSKPGGAFAGFERKPATVDEMDSLLSRWIRETPAG